MRHYAIALIAVILAALFVRSELAVAQGAPAAALESPIGKVIAVEGAATIQHTAVVPLQASVPGGPVAAKVGDLVYIGDVIQTAADGKINLAFADGTALNVFSNARMELNEFVYNPSSNLGSSVFSLVKGSFTFLGGKMAKTGRLTVDTPTATLGIRGTTAHVVIGEDGTVKFSTLVEEKQ